MKAALLSLMLVAVPLLALAHFANACPDPDYGCDPAPGQQIPQAVQDIKNHVPQVGVCTEINGSCPSQIVCVSENGSVKCVRDPCAPPTTCFLG
ncbi:MAG: hypothetical protein QOE90_2775 [Thermoplasmata archaeon]|jgi:hypothetical protein|nr:hypothetical protein [Thermoplasmata archaeon]